MINRKQFLLMAFTAFSFLTNTAQKDNHTHEEKYNCSFDHSVPFQSLLKKGPVKSPLGGVIDYQSDPNSEYVIYLDFDGEYLENSIWGSNINALPPSFSQQEQEIICKIVAADFEPFNVNITTNLSVFEAAEGEKKVQVVFTPTNDASPGSLGVAEVNTFHYKNSPVAWVFYDTTPEKAANIASHEIGHTLALRHDGTNDEEYYSGHGNWVPIMGGSGYGTMTQWSNGDYPNASNTYQNDIAIISSFIPFREDKWKSSYEKPSELGEILQPNQTFSESAIIHNSSDKDIFIFSTSGGNFNVSFSPENNGHLNNLRLRGSLTDASGNPIASAETEGYSDGTISRFLAPGVYTLTFDGVGYYTHSQNGYSDYGSVGNYRFDGAIEGYMTTLEYGITVLGGVPKINCSEDVTANVLVSNYGSENLNDFTIKVYDEEGLLLTKHFNTSINKYQETSVQVTFSPRITGNQSFTFEIEGREDVMASNNTAVSENTRHLKGENLAFEIDTKYNIWKWNVLNPLNDSVIISNEDFSTQNQNGIMSQSFCVPTDSCYVFEVIDPFSNDWCNHYQYIDYYVYGGFDFDHIHQPGDSIINASTVTQQQSLFIVEQEVSQQELLFNWHLYEKNEDYMTLVGGCPLPDGENEYFSLKNLKDGSIVMEQSHEPNNNLFREQACFSSLITSDNNLEQAIKLSVYPNPVENSLNIKALGIEATNSMVSIFNLEGKLLERSKMDLSSNQVIDFTGFSKGIYLITVSFDNHHYHKKIVK